MCGSQGAEQAVVGIVIATAGEIEASHVGCHPAAAVATVSGCVHDHRFLMVCVVGGTNVGLDEILLHVRPPEYELAHHFGAIEKLSGRLIEGAQEALPKQVTPQKMKRLRTSRAQLLKHAHTRPLH